MALPEKLLEKLVCPKCKGKLTYDQPAERLLCHACSLSYRVANDVPVLLVDEAENL